MAQLSPLTLIAPGSRGLNKEKSLNLLSPQWATEAENCIISQSGRIASRKGWTDQTTNAIAATPSIDVMHEYATEADARTVLSVAANKIYKGITDFTDANNDITSSTAPTADHWKFVNFNGKVLGYQDEHNPIEWAGSGDFTDTSFTTTGQPGSPNPGNEVLAAFGRVWYADDDLQTIRYSALLSHTDFTTANGGGSIDMSSIWTQGMDRIVAIAALGANLIVFGKNHIIIWSDGAGSAIGLNPTQMYVTDTIEGTGCIARDSVQAIGEGDLWFLSRHGIQSLTRVISDRNNPLATITKHVRSYMLTLIGTTRNVDANFDAVRSVYHPEDKFYLLFLPTSDRIICIDTGNPFTDEEGERCFPITEWTMGGSIKCGLSRRNGDLLFGSSGVVGKYTGSDDDGSTYTMGFWSGWLDMAELNNRLKLLKEVSAIIQIGGSGSVTYRWDFDFLGEAKTKTLSYTAPTAAEFNVAEYNVDEFSGALIIQRRNFPGRGQGQFLRVGATCVVNNFDFVLQQLQLIPKLGRVAA